MSRMTVSINRINKMLDSISGLEGYAADLVEKGIEPMVESIVDFLHKTSDDSEFEQFIIHGKWEQKVKRQPFVHVIYQCSKCEYLVDTAKNFCSNCGAKMDLE